MSGTVKESFLERYWQVFVIGFGLVLTLFFARYDPRTPEDRRTTQTEPQRLTAGPEGGVRQPVK